MEIEVPSFCEFIEYDMDLFCQSTSNEIIQLQREDDVDDIEQRYRANILDIYSKNATKSKKSRTKEVQQQQVVEVQQICRKIQVNDTFTINSGLSFTSDGVLRFSKSLSQVSFGFQSQEIHQAEYKRDLDVININLGIDKTLQTYPIDRILPLIQRIPGVDYARIETALRNYQTKMNYLQNYFKNENITQSYIQQKDNEFKEHINNCFQYLNEYVKTNPQTMFQYVIGRLNYLEQDVEISYSGYSTAYFELLGLDITSFVAIIMRNQKIDLIKDKSEIMKHTLEGLYSMSGIPYEQISLVINIVTLDGLKIKLYQNKQDISFQNGKPVKPNLQNGYIFYINELDVDLSDLEKLIKYRQNIALNKNLSLDQFIQKELSYLFEDVEYSVHSQNFLEMYYKENLLKLQQKKQYIQCKYKPISSPQTSLVNQFQTYHNDFNHNS